MKASQIKLVFWMKGKGMKKFHGFKEDSSLSLCRKHFVGKAKTNLQELYDDDENLRCRQCILIIKKFKNSKYNGVKIE